MRVLAGDIGGTNARFVLYKKGRITRRAVFESHKYADPADAISEFLENDSVPRIACIGIAGPVIEGRCVTTNLPWIVDQRAIARKTGIEIGRAHV